MMITSFFSPKKTEGGAKRARDLSKDDDLPALESKKLKLEVVDEMLSHLEDHNDKGDGTSSVMTWRKSLEKCTLSQSFQKLAQFVTNERNNSKITIYPPSADIFNALNWTPLDKVKIVIVGQDPYHGPNQAHGLCFSVRKGIAIPPSLRNIYKELANDPGVKNFPDQKKGMPRHGYLERWAKQGVLMLNNVLTVRKGEPNSHRKKGWELFTDQVIRVLLKENKQGLVFLLWGKPAAEKAKNVLGGNRKNITIIQSSHPSPLGASKTKQPFLGSKCFSRANDALVTYGYKPIDWNVD